MKTIDIETMALDTAFQQFDPEKGVPANWKDPDKIKAKIEENRIKFVDRAALSPLTGRIVAIGIRDNRSKVENLILTAIELERERDLIVCLLEDMIEGPFYGYNFIDFDLPFIMTRARLLGMPEANVAYQTLKNNVSDVYREITCWCGSWNKDTLFPNAKLENMAKAMGVRSKLRENQCEGKDFADFICSSLESTREMARNHLTADLIETEALANIAFPSWVAPTVTEPVTK